MCLYSEQRFKTKKAGLTDAGTVATKNIVVYKRFRKNSKKMIFAPVRDFKYEYGKMYKADFDIAPEKDGNKWQITVHAGLHAHTSLLRAVQVIECEEDHVVIQCVIPKGASYIIGADKEIVSTKLRIGKNYMTKRTCRAALRDNNFDDITSFPK